MVSGTPLPKQVLETFSAQNPEVWKRIGWTDIRKLSVSDDEAYEAQYALEKIREALAEQGYNPR